MDPFLEFFGNHPYLFSALGAALVLVAANEIVGAMTGGKRLSPLEAVRLINDRDPIIVDLRAHADYKRGHLLHAVNIPFAKLDERVKELAKSPDKPVLLYCALGSVAAQASEKLKKAGVPEVYPMRGGLNGWIGASLPVTTK
ncbi:MAG: rhodanese-like domain-containing protein [Gammaproteobacteria bacterium]|nr:rhodanese-like domain-containing protein [Gammaproteobacteria bacterium]